MLDRYRSAGQLTSVIQETLHPEVVKLRQGGYTELPTITLDALQEAVGRKTGKKPAVPDSADTVVPMEDEKPQVLLQCNNQRPDICFDQAEQDRHDAVAILSERIDPKSQTTEYLVHWKGYTAAQATWEPKDYVEDSGVYKAWRVLKSQQRRQSRGGR